LLLLESQSVETGYNLLGLSCMALNGISESYRGVVMHKARFYVQSPERRRAQFVGSILRANLDNAIACSNVM